MKDYSHLKGKEISIINDKWSWNYIFVADIDYEKGITIKGTCEEEGEELVDAWCLNTIAKYGKGTYRDAFNWTIKAIESGILDVELYPCYNYSEGQISGFPDSGQNSCAF